MNSSFVLQDSNNIILRYYARKVPARMNLSGWRLNFFAIVGTNDEGFLGSFSVGLATVIISKCYNVVMKNYEDLEEELKEKERAKKKKKKMRVSGKSVFGIKKIIEKKIKRDRNK